MVYDGYYEKDHIGASAAHEYINSLMSPERFSEGTRRIQSSR
jgi:hypothetical protein